MPTTEYTRESLRVARLFMELPINERDAIRAYLIGAAAKYNEKFKDQCAAVYEIHAAHQRKRGDR